VTNGGRVPGRYIAAEAAGVLAGSMDLIRKHGAVSELVDEITHALDRARKSLDVEPFTRFPVGPCPEDCGRTVFAVCPAEGSKRPALMACYLMIKGENRPDLGAGFAHSYLTNTGRMQEPSLIVRQVSLLVRRQTKAATAPVQRTGLTAHPLADSW
jgi:hypothetical protein